MLPAACLLLGGALLAAALLATPARHARHHSPTTAMARIRVYGRQLYAGSVPWRAWGMNWGFGDHDPVDAYFDNPTPARLAVLTSELQIARTVGANSMRIFLQLGQVMATPTRPRRQTLTALKQLLALAQSQHIYLDITGNLVWQPSRAPNWYEHMPTLARWQVQARFWKAVAQTAADFPSVLCYELTSEPIVAPSRRYYYGRIGHRWFVQSIATGHRRHADALAHAWTRLLADAIRTQDNRPITIGLLPNITGPFAPTNVADLLDMLVVHEYPRTGRAFRSVALVQKFAAFNKPVLLGETFTLTDDTATQTAFLAGAASHLVGAFEFFDGRNPINIHIHTMADAIYQSSLKQFQALRPVLLGESTGAILKAAVPATLPRPLL